MAHEKKYRQQIGVRECCLLARFAYALRCNHKSPTYIVPSQSLLFVVHLPVANSVYLHFGTCIRLTSADNVATHIVEQFIAKITFAAFTMTHDRVSSVSQKYAHSCSYFFFNNLRNRNLSTRTRRKKESRSVLSSVQHWSHAQKKPTHV